MDPILKILFWMSMVSIVNCHQLLPFGSYRHDIQFPAIAGQFQATSIPDQLNEPIHQLSAGFHLNPPPLHFINQPFSISPPAFASNRNGFFPGGQFGAPLFKLFTPNTRQQRPESRAQEEEYIKYLTEEAEELEKEKNQNEITTDFTDFSIDAIEATTLPFQSKRQTFVRLNINGKDYGYSS